MKYSEFMVIQGDSMVASWEDILWRYEIEWRYNGISNHIDMILGYFGCIWNWGILSIKMHFNENNDDKPWDLGCPVFRQTHVVPLIQRTWGFWKFGRWWYQSESMQTCRNRGFEHVIFWLNIEHRRAHVWSFRHTIPVRLGIFRQQRSSLCASHRFGWSVLICFLCELKLI